MNSRLLTKFESENLACINRAGISSTLLFVTGTGLQKSILDATEPMRAMLRSAGVHDYAVQRQGQENKRTLEAVVHTITGMNPVAVSLYRPVTKRGDPRLWFSRFREHAAPDDVCAIFVHDEKIHVLNLTTLPLAAQVAHDEKTALSRFFIAQFLAVSSVAEELLGKLRSLASAGPLEAVCAGSTAIGRSIETALGIQINSSRNPDYQGIELKAGRSAIAGRENRATLFACVPDWSVSRCKSSKAILDEFGYARDGKFKLYCTISTQRSNSQGLMFELEEANRWLPEKCVREPVREVAVWRISTLEDSLAAKHRETFWIKAKSSVINGREHFHLQSVIHTRNPNLPQFERMLRDGSITMDHLIKRTPAGGAQEKGPLFKVVRPRIKELFLGEPQNYELS